MSLIIMVFMSIIVTPLFTSRYILYSSGSCSTEGP